MTRGQIQDHVRRIGEQEGLPVHVDAELAPLLSMRVGGAAAALLRPQGVEQTRRVANALDSAGVPTRFLGGGSNLIAVEEDLNFAVLHVGALPDSAEWEGRRVRVPAGTPLATLVRDAMKRGLSGLEWAAGLPGSVGGAVVGNAGAFGGEVGRHVRKVVLLGSDGVVREQELSEDDFAYRKSFVRPGELVLEVEIELEDGDPAEVKALTADINRRRAGSQPKGGHSSGCIFKNPAGDSAGRLIDQCGLKGRRRGGASVSETHANFIINDGTASATDLLGLIDELRAEVKRQAGVELELELRVWRGDDGEAT